MPIGEQIVQGRLVCPVSRTRLEWRGDGVTTVDGARRYPVIGAVPVLLPDPKAADEYARSGTQMLAEYAPERHTPTPRAKLSRWAKAAISRDHRTPASRRAYAEVFNSLPPGSLALAIGGGPTRGHAAHVNLNIGAFPNVDVVGDAHRLPYADGAVDAVHCEAVLEHLVDPWTAVREMRRVLRPGALVFAATPFMQPYHGYPHHYQNFTLTGHRALFENAGFLVEDAGTCVGPVFTLVDVLQKFVQVYGPLGLGYPASILVRMLGAFAKLADLHYRHHEESHVLASTTYLVARRPD